MRKLLQSILIKAFTLVLLTACGGGDDNVDNPPTIHVTRVSLNTTAMTLTVGNTGTLMATVAPENATNKSIAWSSNNTAVATVANGQVTAVSPGNAKITVTTADGQKTATCDITVEINQISLLDSSIDPDSRLAVYTLSPEQSAIMTGDYETFFLELQAITRGVYAQFRDDFDFIFYVFDRPLDENFISKIGGVGFYGLNTPVSKLAESGIGKNSALGDYREDYGVATGGKLKSLVTFPFCEAIHMGPCLHELFHQWGMFLKELYTDSSSIEQFHWGYSNAGGQLGGFKYIRTVEQNSGGVTGKTYYQGSMKADFSGFWAPNANGGNSIPYSDIELYLMGLKSAQELRDANFTLDIYKGITSDGTFADGYFWATGVDSYTIDDIISIYGARTPASSASQKEFKILAVVLTETGQTTHYYADIIKDLKWFSGAQSEATYPGLYNFSKATGGRASVITNGVKNSLRSSQKSAMSATWPETPYLRGNVVPNSTHIDRPDDHLLARPLK